MKLNKDILYLKKKVDKLYKPWNYVINKLSLFIVAVFGSIGYILYGFYRPVSNNINKYKPFAMPAFEWIHGKKTYIISILGMLLVSVGFLQDSVSFEGLATTSPQLIAIATLRHAIARATGKKTISFDQRIKNAQN